VTIDIRPLLHIYLFVTPRLHRFTYSSVKSFSTSSSHLDMRRLAFPVPSGVYVRLERSYCTVLAWRNWRKHEKYRCYACHSGSPSKVSRTVKVLLRNMDLFFCFTPGTWWSAASGRKSHRSIVASLACCGGSTRHNEQRTASVSSPLLHVHNHWYDKLISP
jgi:hypothetical protein